MEGGFQHLDIVLLAIAAGFILYRLAGVLGRRTGHERQRFNPYAAAKGDTGEPVEGAETIPAMPPQTRGRKRERVAQVAPQGSPLARALSAIAAADRQFDVDTFLAGARIAYEMIVTAFAKPDRETLKELLSEEVYRDFESAIAARERRGETLDQRFVGLRSAEIESAALNGRIAQVSVRFVSEIVSCTKNAEGAVIDGDPTTIHEVRDLWTFARDTRSSDLNWKLVATQSG